MKGKNQVFVNGMHSDNDPRYQPEGSYRDAENIKLTSRDGNTFTVENVLGNKKTFDLPCTAPVFVLESIVNGSNPLTVGTQYAWEITHTDYDAAGVQQSNAVSRIPSTGYHTYTTQFSLIEMISDELNLITQSGGPNAFNSTHNSNQVVIQVNQDNTNTNYINIIGIGPVTGTAVTTWNNGWSTYDDTEIDNAGTTKSTVPLYFSQRYLTLCDFTIVGYYSNLNTLYLFTNDINETTVSGSHLGSLNGQIWKIDFNNAGEKETITLLYSNELGFSKSKKLIVEAVLENDCITRLYWTDNTYPIRSINITDPNCFAFSLNDLKMSPEVGMDRPVLKAISAGGDLEVGMYQVGYKLLSQGGSSTSMSPLSNLIHISSGDDNNYNSPNSGDPTIGKASPGTITGKSFSVEIQNIDTDFHSIEFYILVYEVYNSGPTKILKSNYSLINGSNMIYNHTTNNLTEVVLGEFLIEGNTFDTAKDISIKDNRLFAANLKTSSKDLSSFNTKVKRWRGNEIEASATTSGWSNKQFTNGKLTNDTSNWADNNTDHKYLPYAVNDRNGNPQALLGAQTEYFDETNGGIRITFQTEDRIIDTEKDNSWYTTDAINSNTNWNFHLIDTALVSTGNKKHLNTQGPTTSQADNEVVTKLSSDTLGNSQIDNHSENVNTFYQDIEYDTNENPFISYDSRGYQRGEIYRFSIVLFDKNGREIQTRYIGDIKMPDHQDEQWRFNDDKDLTKEHDGTTASGGSGYEIYDSLNSMLNKNIYCEDFRLSYIKGIRNPYNDYGTSDGSTQYHNKTDDTMSTEDFPFWMPATKDGGSNFTETPLQNDTNYRYPDSTSGDTTYGDVDFIHRAQDLHLRFEVIIPDNIKDIVGGYKIVRVKREQNDRTILGQGLLTQCVYNEDASGEDPGNGLADLGTNDSGKSSWASNVHEKFTPFCNPIHDISDSQTSNSSAYNGVRQPSLGIGPSHDNTSVGEFNVNQGQLNVFNAGKGVGYNRYFTFDCPDYDLMSNSYRHASGSKIDVISVLKNIDTAKHKTFEAHGSTDLGCNWDIGNENDTSRLGIFHSRRYIPVHSRASSFADRLHRGMPDCFYTKFVTYDTKSMKNPSSLINLLSTTVISTTSSTAGKLDYYWQNNLEINSSSLVGYGEQSIINSIQFANRNTDYTLLNTSSNFGTYLHSGSTVRMNTEFNESSVGRCSKTVFIELKDDTTPGENILSVPSIDRAYIRKSDTPHVGQSVTFGSNLRLSESRTPYALLANITRVLESQYGGLSDSSVQNNRFIDTGHFTYLGSSYNGVQTSKVSGGDTFVQFYSKEKYNGGSIDKELLIQGGQWDELRGGNQLIWYYPVETFVNTSLADGVKKTREKIFQNFPINDNIDMFNLWRTHGSEDWDYNEVYSQESDVKAHIVINDDECESTYFPNQIAYSQIKLSGETKTDAWKSFHPFDFHDVDRTHGPINNLFVLNDYMYFLQNRSVGVLDVNPKTLISTTEGSQLHAGTGDTIQNHRYITTKYGSQHQHSLVLSDSHSYFVDAIHEKLFKFDGKKIESISDLKGMSNFMRKAVGGSGYLGTAGLTNVNQIKTNDTPLLFNGIHGGYDKESGNVIYTFFDLYNETSYNKNTIVYNDRSEIFVSNLSIYPTLWIPHMNRLYTNNAREYNETDQTNAKQDEVWEWEGMKYGTNPFRTCFFSVSETTPDTGTIHGFYIEPIINQGPQDVKIFDNMGVVMNMENWEQVNTADNNLSKLGSEMVGLGTALGNSTTFEEILMSTELSDFTNIGTHKITNQVAAAPIILGDSRVIYREGVLWFPTREEGDNEGNPTTKGRLRGTYMKIKLKAINATNKFNIFALKPFFRKSYK